MASDWEIRKLDEEFSEREASRDRAYSMRTGNCANCRGSGTIIRGSAPIGQPQNYTSEVIACDSCGGTGKRRATP